MISESDQKRFWAKVQKTETCWLWTGAHGAKTGYQYGMLGLNGRLVKAHRFSYELHFGPIPEGKDVCHTCDNPPCVRPDHLFAGSTSENILDSVKKGRWIKGDKKNGRQKLTLPEVREIRAKYDSMPSYTQGLIVDLAKEYKVTRHCIEGVVYRESWKDRT